MTDIMDLQPKPSYEALKVYREPSPFREHMMKIQCGCGLTHRVPLQDIWRPIEWWHETVMGPDCIIPPNFNLQIRRQLLKLRARRAGLELSESQTLLRL